jgi:DNA-binding NtrC family response regulator
VEPLARISLAQDAPGELRRTLPLLGLEPLPQSGSGWADVHVDFAPRAESTDALPASGLRIALDERRRSLTPNADFISDSMRAIGCFILSHALKLSAPFLTAEEGTFAMIRAAIAVARSSAPIIVEGETGNGKESLVRLIYAAGGGSSVLVRVDCATLENNFSDGQFPPEAAASAPASKQDDAGTGVGSTVHFSRMSELSPASQLKVLRVIVSDRDGSVRPLGGTPRAGALRVIASSARSLAAMSARGEFLPEFHSLFDLTLTIPPLRERRADIPMLARYFLRRVRPELIFSAEALRILTRYVYPGNVRELQNLVTRLAIVPLAVPGRVIGPDDVIGQLWLANPPHHGSGKLFKLSRGKICRDIAAQVLLSSGGNAEIAARTLGITPRAMLRLTTLAVTRQPRRGRGARRA